MIWDYLPKLIRNSILDKTIYFITIKNINSLVFQFNLKFLSLLIFMLIFIWSETSLHLKI